MSFLDLGQSKSFQVGNDAGWQLEFYKVADDWAPGELVKAFSASDYYASIEANLQDGLWGGSYSITIEGLTDEDYGLISQAKEEKPSLAKLYLFWRDSISGPASYLGNLAGLSPGLGSDDLKKALVAVLRVTRVRRKLGALSYDTEISGVEWAHFAMSLPLGKPLETDDFKDAAKKLGERFKIEIVVPTDRPRLTKEESGPEKATYAQGRTGGSILGAMAEAIEVSLNMHGRGMLLVRDGKIYLGPRKYPLEGDPKELTALSGLLEAMVDGSSETDPAAPKGSGAKERPHFRLTLKGRPDIKPGDVVRFDPPKEDSSRPALGSALLGALAGPLLPVLGVGLSDEAVTLAVASVTHRLGKDAGFSTEVAGVKIDSPDKAWDEKSDEGSVTSPPPRKVEASAANDAAAAIHEQLDTMSSNIQTIEIGEVSSFTAKKSGSEPPSQTETAWEGLKSTDRNPNGTRRLATDHGGKRIDIPYSSPFAWGKCGLILPRYPGMRVVLAHRRGRETEAIDIGATWGPDSAAGPDSKPGDYWLSLPAGVPEASRDRSSDANPKPHEGKVTNDLVDADGIRVIEVGMLTVRVGKDVLDSAGNRPGKSSSSGDRVVVKHKGKGALLEIDQNGAVYIFGSSISLDAGDGDISIAAKNVNVKVKGSMNVE